MNLFFYKFFFCFTVIINNVSECEFELLIQVALTV